MVSDIASVDESTNPPGRSVSAGQWTPGPWHVGEDDHNGQAIVRAEHIEIATCWHHCVGSIEREMRANARLIAAAPDLLEALKAIQRRAFSDGSRTFDDCSRDLGLIDDLARAAIAQVRGERDLDGGEA